MSSRSSMSSLLVLPLGFHTSLDVTCQRVLEEANVIVLPRTVLDQHAFEVNLPRFFVVDNPITRVRLHVAVHEYSAPDGLAYLPRRLMARAGIVDMGQVTVTSEWPHSARYVRLAMQPSQEGSSPAPVMGALDDYVVPLTIAFQQRYQVISLNDELSIVNPYAPSSCDEPLRFKVLEVQPDTVVSTVDTDVQIDIDALPTAAPITETAASTSSGEEPVVTTGESLAAVSHPPSTPVAAHKDETVSSWPAPAATMHASGTAVGQDVTGRNNDLRQLHEARMRRRQSQPAVTSRP
jgi:hypothetical protein